MTHEPMKRIVLCSPSGALLEPDRLDRAVSALQSLSFEVKESVHCRTRYQRFAGTDEQRLSDVEAVLASTDRSLIMASRGGYGASRLMDKADWPTLARHLNAHQHVLCGHSDITAIQLALMAAGARPEHLLHGPMASFDFGEEAGVHESTLQYFLSSLGGQVSIHWEGAIYDRDDAGSFEPLEGPVWGGNLTMLCALVGTPCLPKIQAGILILEDVNEPVYKIERMLLQLHQAGVLATQQAIVLGQFNEPAPSVHDNGYDLSILAQYFAKLTGLPVLTQFPFGHCTPKCCWYQGKKGQLRQVSPSTNGLPQWSLVQS